MPHLHVSLALILLASCANAQVTLLGTPFLGTASEPFEGAHSPPFQPCVAYRLFGGTADLCTPGSSSAHTTSSWGYVCSIPAHGGTRFYGTASSSGPTWAEYDFDNVIYSFGGYFGRNGPPGTTTVEFRDSAGVLIDSVLANIPVNCEWIWNGWQSTTGIKEIRVINSVDNGTHIMMDDMVLDDTPPFIPPTCTITTPIGPVMDDVTIDFDTASATSPLVDLTFEHSIDGGLTWIPSTPAPTSLLGNPEIGAPTGVGTFVWASRTDAVGLTMPTTVRFQLTVRDGGPQPGTCLTTQFIVDNTMLCNGICGDCDLNAVGPSILDALVAAQIAAAIITPSPLQMACCDVDATLTVTVLDALRIAQAAAALPVTLTCP